MHSSQFLWLWILSQQFVSVVVKTVCHSCSGFKTLPYIFQHPSLTHEEVGCDYGSPSRWLTTTCHNMTEMLFLDLPGSVSSGCAAPTCSCVFTSQPPPPGPDLLQPGYTSSCRHMFPRTMEQGPHISRQLCAWPPGAFGPVWPADDSSPRQCRQIPSGKLPAELLF